MKFSAAATLAVLAGFALAAPTKLVQRDGEQIAKRAWTMGKIAVAQTLAGGALGFVGGPVANRVLNDIFGVQKKRSIHVDPRDVTLEEARGIFIEAFVDTLLKQNPYDGNDAAFCSGVRYSISDPAATLDYASFNFTVGDETSEFDCFVVSGPVTVEVASNATDAVFAFAAPEETSTWENGVLTLE